jgi:hypothetical protein
MNWTRPDDLVGDVDTEGGADRITVTTDFDRGSNPELFVVLAPIAPGKQRAQRLRMLALKGLMFEQMQSMPLRTPPLGSPATRPTQSGADDVFGAPLES